ncbi:MAG: rod shape-determining protein [Lachnospiraceae bacterium]|jgi:hypothetical protein|nr:rod shape-determining protein [Lachnospiraceae bacterium]
MGVEFKDNREAVKEKLRQCGTAWLHEASAELNSQVMRNQRVRTGRTKGSWRYLVDEEKMEAYVASDAMNAVYEEFGTGEYALEGNGRKGGWWYMDEKGKYHFTKGKKPHRPLYRAYVMLKEKIIARAKAIFQEMMA